MTAARAEHDDQPPDRPPVQHPDTAPNKAGPVELPVTLRIPDDTATQIDFSDLPAQRGVALFEAADHRPLAIAITSDLRRLARRRLTPPNTSDDSAPSRQRGPDWRAMTHIIRATTCGSAFEADVLWLKLAQRLLPHAATAASDRWQCWFVHVDPDAQHPWFTKTRHPGSPPTGQVGVYLGPVPDKHAASRCIDALNGMFDLCRYRHVLVQTPHGAACAYKEIGRCPAPCDGSIEMSAYRAQVREASHCVTHTLAAWIEQQQAAMHKAVAAQEYEHAGLVKRRLDDADSLRAPKFRFLSSLERFCFVSIQQSPSDRHGRVFLIHGGSVRACMDIALDISTAEARDVIAALLEQARKPVDIAAMSNADHQMMGLISHHLFMPTRLQRGCFAAPADLTPTSLRRLTRTAAGRWQKHGNNDTSSDDEERMIESIDA